MYMRYRSDSITENQNQTFFIFFPPFRELSYPCFFFFPLVTPTISTLDFTSLTCDFILLFPCGHSSFPSPFAITIPINRVLLFH
jgi:hypothetical protein